MLEIFNKILEKILLISQNIGLYVFILALISVFTFSILLNIKLKFKHFYAVIFGFKDALKNLFDKKEPGIKKYLYFSRNFVAYASMSNILGLFFIVNLYGEGALFWYFIFSLALLPLDFVLSIAMKMYKKTKENYMVGGIIYVYGNAKKLIKNKFLKHIFSGLSIISLFSLIVIYIVSSSTIPVKNLYLVTKNFFDINQMEFFFIMLIPSLLAVFLFNFKKRRFLYISYFIIFFVFFVYLLAYFFLNIEKMFVFFRSIIERSFDIKFLSLSGIFIIAATIKGSIYASSYGLGISNSFEIQTIVKHPVENGILKVLLLTLSFIFSFVICFLFIDNNIFSSSDNSDYVNIFRNLIYFNLTQLNVIILYILFFLNFIFILMINIKNIKILLRTLNKENFYVLTKILMVIIIILSSFQELYYVSFFSNLIFNLTFILTSIVLFTNSLSIFLLNKDILHAVENFQENLFSLKKRPYIFHDYWQDEDTNLKKELEDL